MNADQAVQFTRMFYEAYPGTAGGGAARPGPEAVHGAVQYARTLGFDPAPDFDATRDRLGPWSDKCAITFGRDGKPFFIQGPRDNSALVVSQLRRTVGQDNFEYLIAVWSSRTDHAQRP